MSFLDDLSEMLFSHAFEDAVSLINTSDEEEVKAAETKDGVCVLGHVLHVWRGLELEGDNANAAMLEAIRALVRKGAHVDGMSTDRTCVLHYAIANCEWLCGAVAVLIEDGEADVDMMCAPRLCPQFELSPLGEAIRRRNASVVQMLLDAGADVDMECCTEMQWEQWHSYDECPDMTPLGMCIWEGSLDCMSKLIAFGANVNLICATKYVDDDDGKKVLRDRHCPLSFAFKCNRGQEPIKALLRAGAKTDVCVVDSFAETSLSDLVIAGGNTEKVEILCSTFARCAILQLLLIRRFRKGVLCTLPIQLVEIIAKFLWSSRAERIWLANDGRTSSKRRNCKE